MAPPSGVETKLKVGALLQTFPIKWYRNCFWVQTAQWRCRVRFSSQSVTNKRTKKNYKATLTSSLAKMHVIRPHRSCSLLM